METGLYHAHSGLRYLVLLAGVVAAAVLLAGFFTRKPWGKPSRIAMAVYGGLMGLQALLGIAMVGLGRFYPSLMGHLTLMVLAVVAAHGFSMIARKQTDGQRAHSLGLIGVALSVALIVFGILAIRDGVFESRAFGVTAESTE